MSVDELRADVATAGEKVAAALAAVTTARQALEEAQQTLAQATQGASAPEVTQALGLLAQAAGQDGAAGLEQTINAAAGGITAYLDKHPGEPAGDVPAPSSGSAPPAPSNDSTVDKLRRDLPERTPGKRGQKTHGQWFAAGKPPAELVSGRDKLTDRVDDVLAEAGCPRRPVTAANDVELKLAAHMRDQGIADASVVINNKPCKGALSCDELVPVVLPPGSSLTVYGPDGFVKTYRGGAKPWRT
ncbi:DddA-like double-stranded DNA deaminase toxin [Amycolatopsis sp. CA-128772]|uniref:DddA-like double-stranded DNA deaminase toxin n=1 Tax=Amycolatopsis sp. CA-128772 TaxID=2073159 RepID=UPI0018EB9547|nr:DddA-like double-stranded DNA deaminase toxin [Amycolatopsis sp. CA-128772]